MKFRHGAGPWGFPLVDGANQSGSVLLTKDWDFVPTRGDPMQIVGVNKVNPNGLSFPDTGLPCTFSVTGVDLRRVWGSCGSFAVSIFPALIPLGHYMNVSNLPANGAAILMPDVSA